MPGEDPATPSAGPSASDPPVVLRALSVAADHAQAGRDATARLLYEQVLSAGPAATRARAHDGLADLGPAAPRRGRSVSARAFARLARPRLETAAQRPRIWKYRVLSTCPHVTGSPRLLQPTLLLGPGDIVLGEGVQFGWKRSPLFFTGYCHVEAATPIARIEIGDRTEFNNNALLKSEGPGIRVGPDGLFGANVELLDSDFHDLHPARRHGGTPRTAPVEVGRNVFVGMGVKILKGVTIGADSVIGAGAVVTSSIPAGVIAAGNPARVVREL